MLDGAAPLFKGKIVVDDEDRKVVKEGGGAAWLRIRKAKVEMKFEHDNTVTFGHENMDLSLRRRSGESVTTPKLLDSRFLSTLRALEDGAGSQEVSQLANEDTKHINETREALSTKASLKSLLEGTKWQVVSRLRFELNNEHEVGDIMAQIESSFHEQKAKSSDVVSTLILLRSMGSFPIINKVCIVFKHENPPVYISSTSSICTFKSLMLG